MEKQKPSPKETLSKHLALLKEKQDEALIVCKSLLCDYAKRHNGQYLLYGSRHKGTASLRSDVDVLVDFPSTEQQKAWLFGEKILFDCGFIPDITTVDYCEPWFVEAVAKESESLR